MVCSSQQSSPRDKPARVAVRVLLPSVFLLQHPRVITSWSKMSLPPKGRRITRATISSHRESACKSILPALSPTGHSMHLPLSAPPSPSFEGNPGSTVLRWVHPFPEQNCASKKQWEGDGSDQSAAAAGVKGGPC